MLYRHYQEVLPAEGLGRTQGPKIPIEQMFSDYVHTRGLSNWKFWIVSLKTARFSARLNKHRRCFVLILSLRYSCRLGHIDMLKKELSRPKQKILHFCVQNVENCDKFPLVSRHCCRATACLLKPEEVYFGSSGIILSRQGNIFPSLSVLIACWIFLT